MGKETRIAWTDHTFNPWIGCTKVGPGCDHCYAETMDARKRWDGGKTHWGAGVTRYRTSESNWRQPLAWNRAAERDGVRRRVFCASLADVFDNEVPPIWRENLWRLIEATPHLEWLIVTKRIGNVKGWMLLHGWLSNARLIITVCNQEEADRDIPKLLALPCKNGISYEPGLGAIDFQPWLPVGAGDTWKPCREIDWIIIGGESGPKARPFNIEWAHSTIAQCKAAGVPCFVKQLGRRPTGSGRPWCDKHGFENGAGANPSEWPEDLRVREFPE